MSGPSRRSAGITLLELLVAVTILGVAMVSMLGLHARNVRLTSETQDLTIATMLAGRLVAEVQASNTPPLLGVTTGTFTDDDERLEFVGADVYGGSLGDRFQWRREVQNRDLGAIGIPVSVPHVRVSVGTRETPELAVLVLLRPAGVIP